MHIGVHLFFACLEQTMPRSQQKKAMQVRLAAEQAKREAAEAALVEERAKRMFGDKEEQAKDGRKSHGNRRGKNNGRTHGQGGRPQFVRKTREEMTPEEHLEDRQRLQDKILNKMDEQELHDKKHEFHANPAMVLPIGGESARTDWLAVRQLAMDAYREAMTNQRLVPLWLYDDWMQMWYDWSNARAGSPQANITNIPMDNSLFFGWMRSLGKDGQKFCRKFPVKWLSKFAEGNKEDFDEAMYEEVFVDTDLQDREGNELWDWDELIDHLWEIVVKGKTVDNTYVSVGVYERLRKVFDPLSTSSGSKPNKPGASAGAQEGAAKGGVLKAGLYY